MRTIDQVLVALHEYDKQCQTLLPRRYYDEVAKMWFIEIGPIKTREYGVACWERLGPRGFVVNMSAMRYRWTRLMELGRDLNDPAMYNCVLDGFGFAILFNLCLDIPYLSYTGDTKELPRVDDEWIIQTLWDGEGPPWEHEREEIGYRAMRMAYNMWWLAP